MSSTERGGQCAWCGHTLARVHDVRMAGALVRRHCDRCAECGAWEPAWVKRARSAALPVKEYGR